MIDWLRSEFELLGQLVQQKISITIEPCLMHITVHEKSHKKRKLLYGVLECFSGCFFWTELPIPMPIFTRKKRLGRIFAHYAWHKGLQMQWLEFLESTASYCLRICCKIQESRHWLMLFSSSGLDQWETDPMSWSQLSCQLHSWHKGTCEYHTISTFNPASNPIHLDLQSNKKWHPECCWL